MRENRTHGSEGGESGSTGPPYPYPHTTATRFQLVYNHEGWIRPMVVLPSATFIERHRRTIEVVLLHELTHVARHVWA